MGKLIRSLIAAPVLALAASAGHAVSLGTSDPQGDFLSTYAGVQNGAVDVLFAYSIFDQASSSFTFGATMAGPISGAASGTQYIWGVNRGGGTARLNTGATPVGSGVLFDSVIALSSAGTGQVNQFVPSQPTISTVLSPGAVVISGNSITVTVAASLLPNNGFTFANYQWNLWPRVGSGNNNQITDFAPDNSTIGVLAITPVPEPDALAMMLAGLGLVGFIARRRGKAA
jgi:hypothetical protein